MRAMSLLFVVASMACHTPQQRRVGFIGGGVLATAGVIMLVQVAVDDCEAGFSCSLDRSIGKAFGAGSLLLGATILLVTAAGGDRSPAPQPPPVSGYLPPLPPPPVVRDPPPGPPSATVTAIPDADTVGEPPTTDRTLRQLTLQASMAARRGQCQGVRVIAARVAQLDASYRRVGFVADARIAGCLR
jgi:hypothetical protein